MFVFNQIIPDFEPCIGSGGSSGLNNYRLLLATSADGTHWTRTGMVLADRASVADALVLQNGRILIYYVAGCIQVNGNELASNHIKLAISDDKGISWYYKNVVFNNLPPQGTLPVDPNVVLLDNGNINMLVTIDPDQTGNMKPCTYSALSTDGGFTFSLSNNAVFSIQNTDILDPENFRFGNQDWKLWTGGIPGQNILGVSVNEAISFSDQGTFCAAVNTDIPNECYITADVIKFDSNSYKMYAFGVSPTGKLIKSLSSPDGNTWTLDTNINLSVLNTSGYEYLDVWAPAVAKINTDTFLMIYETNIPSIFSTSFNEIKILENDTALNINDNLKIHARTFYSDFTIRDVTFFGSWNSTQPTVANIDNWGNISAISPGTTYIYKTYNNINSDSLLISVLPSTPTKLISKSFSIYPIPADKYLIIHSEYLNEQFSINIYDMLGHLIIQSHSYLPKTVLNIDSLIEGLYIIQIFNNNYYFTSTFTKSK